jgi:hypothetical protein
MLKSQQEKKDNAQRRQNEREKGKPLTLSPLAKSRQHRPYDSREFVLKKKLPNCRVFFGSVSSRFNPLQFFAT